MTKFEEAARAIDEAPGFIISINSDGSFEVSCGGERAEFPSESEARKYGIRMMRLAQTHAAISALKGPSGGMVAAFESALLHGNVDRVLAGRPYTIETWPKIAIELQFNAALDACLDEAKAEGES